MLSFSKVEVKRYGLYLLSIMRYTDLSKIFKILKLGIESRMVARVWGCGQRGWNGEMLVKKYKLPV